jgi:stringent starvation protein B
MTSSRPYLIRAVHEWIVDNSLTPQVVVDAEFEGVQVPRQYVSDGRIVLNVSERAVRSLVIGNERIEFGARFGGVVFQVSVPVTAVQAVIARENGAGMSFPRSARRGVCRSQVTGPSGSAYRQIVAAQAKGRGSPQ